MKCTISQNVQFHYILYESTQQQTFHMKLQRLILLLLPDHKP